MAEQRVVTEPDTPAAFVAAGVSRRFGAVRALQDVTLRLQPGTVTALLGENGAGKSTLIRVCSGELPADEGRLFLEEDEVAFKNPLEAMRSGVLVVHQEPQLVNELPIATNIFIHHLGERHFAAPITVHRQVEAAEALIERLGMAGQVPHPSRLCRDLSAAERQLVDIIRALSREPRVLFLDEPNSSLARQETERLFTVVNRLRHDGVAVAFVSHRLAEVYEICERVVVLRDGRLVAEGTAEEIPIARAVNLMAGERMIAAVREAKSERGALSQQSQQSPTLELEGCSGEGFDDVSLAVRPGEIIGMAGLVGAGRSEIARAVVGVDKLTGGTVRIAGEKTHLRNPRHAQRAGVVYAAEERRTQVFHSQDVAFNLTARVLERLGPVGTVRPRIQRSLAKRLAERFSVKAAALTAPITSLSGGNQQKVLLSRALASEPRVLILDEPTRGVDVGTKAEIYANLRKLAHEGNLAIWFISSEMEEILELADRIVVVRHGRVVRNEPNDGQAAPVVAAAIESAATVYVPPSR